VQKKITIVTVTFRDAWNLSKTMQSTFDQNQDLFEYIIVNGGDDEETDSIIEFWRKNGKKDFKYVKEKDDGVYDAMNKGVKYATGDYICFMNAGDRFKSPMTIDYVYDVLANSKVEIDALLGWGELGDELYSSWVVSSAYKLSPLGFCHQSLYMKKTILEKEPFLVEKGRTDSDTRQLGRAMDMGISLLIIDEILASRAIDHGISANMETTQRSIVKTTLELYPFLSKDQAEKILEFRRYLKHQDEITELFKKLEQQGQFIEHLALMVLDTLLIRVKARESIEKYKRLLEVAYRHVRPQNGRKQANLLANLHSVQLKTLEYYKNKKTEIKKLDIQRANIEKNEEKRTAQVTTSEVADLVVSLTSFPKRLRSLHIVIKSLLNQTVKPKKIYVYLSLNEVKNIEWLPKKLRELEGEFVSFIGIDENLFQYKKYIYTHNINKESPIVTVDDDVIYPSNAIECLWRAHQQQPHCVIANRAHRIGRDDEGSILPYIAWDKEIYEPEADIDIFPTGCGGVLYPIGFVSGDVVNQVKILAAAPYADDVWLKAVAIERGIPALTSDMLKTSRSWYLGYTPEMRIESLQDINVESGLNDFQLRQAFNCLESKVEHKEVTNVD